MIRKALGFGLNCVNPDFFSGWAGYLNACWDDCQTTTSRMATAGYEALGFYDEDCTLARARAEIGEASNVLVAGDNFVFSNSGHGSQHTGPWFGTEEGLVLYDGILVDSEFRQLLSKFKPGVNVICILDVCHSAGLERHISSLDSPKVAPIRATRNAPGFTKPVVDVAANVIIMASCQRDELSLDGDKNGAFTGSLLATLTEDMTWKQWMVATSRYMSSRFTQHPALIVVGGSGLQDEQIA